jgi:hypothetical protein
VNGSRPIAITADFQGFAGVIRWTSYFPSQNRHF